MMMLMKLMRRQPAAITNVDGRCCILSLICLCLCRLEQKGEAAWQQLRMQMRRPFFVASHRLIRLSAPGVGLPHYFGQDYAIIPGWAGLWDYPGRDYAIIGLRGVVVEG